VAMSIRSAARRDKLARRDSVIKAARKILHECCTGGSWMNSSASKVIGGRGAVSMFFSPSIKSIINKQSSGRTVFMRANGECEKWITISNLSKSEIAMLLIRIWSMSTEERGL
jgi:hypothetical protein